MVLFYTLLTSLFCIFLFFSRHLGKDYFRLFIFHFPLPYLASPLASHGFGWGVLSWAEIDFCFQGFWLRMGCCVLLVNTIYALRFHERWLNGTVAIGNTHRGVSHGTTSAQDWHHNHRMTYESSLPCGT
jgi:hypothetical protein